MGGWILINQIGALLFLSIDLVVVNKILGVEAGGQYGAVLMWSTLLRSFAGVVAAVFGPTIISLYAQQDTTGLVAYSRRAVKFVGLMIALPVGLVCGFARPLLRIWLGPSFEPLAPLMVLMCVHLCVNLAVLPLFNIQIAGNYVRLPGILTCVMGVGNLGLSLLLAGPFAFGMYGVAGAGAVMLTLKNLIFTPIYSAHVLGLGYRSFYREILPVVGATVGLACTGWWMARSIQLDTWLGLSLAGFVLFGIFVVAIFRILLSSEERHQALSMVMPRRIVSSP
jgi:membrane protein EpsK